MVSAGDIFVGPLSPNWLTQLSVVSTLGHSKNNQTAEPATTHIAPSVFKMPKITLIGQVTLPTNCPNLRKINVGIN